MTTCECDFLDFSPCGLGSMTVTSGVLPFGMGAILVWVLDSVLEVSVEGKGIEVIRRDEKVEFGGGGGGGGDVCTLR